MSKFAFVVVALSLAGCSKKEDKPAASAAAPSAPVAAAPAAPASKPVEAAAPSDALTIPQLAEQFGKDKAGMKGKHVKIRALYMATSWNTPSKDAKAVSLKPSKDDMAPIMNCLAGKDGAALAAAHDGVSQWTPVTVEGDVIEDGFNVGLDHCVMSH